MLTLDEIGQIQQELVEQVDQDLVDAQRRNEKKIIEAETFWATVAVPPGNNELNNLCGIQVNPSVCYQEAQDVGGVFECLF